MSILKVVKSDLIAKSWFNNTQSEKHNKTLLRKAQNYVEIRLSVLRCDKNT